MPQVQALFYREDLEVPVYDWILQQSARVQDKLTAAIERLEELGNELRRPHVDLLRDGIWELRVRDEHVNYRILYSFHGQGLVLLSHGLTKEREVSDAEIRRARERRGRFERNPGEYSAEVD